MVTKMHHSVVKTNRQHSILNADNRLAVAERTFHNYKDTVYVCNNSNKELETLIDCKPPPRPCQSMNLHPITIPQWSKFLTIIPIKI